MSKHLERDCEVVFHIIDRMSRPKTVNEFLRRINAHCLRRLHEIDHDKLERKVAKQDRRE